MCFVLMMKIKFLVLHTFSIVVFFVIGLVRLLVQSLQLLLFELFPLFNVFNNARVIDSIDCVNSGELNMEPVSLLPANNDDANFIKSDTPGVVELSVTFDGSDKDANGNMILKEVLDI